MAKEFTQKEGIDYEEIFSLVAMLYSIRVILSIVVRLDYKIWQMDVKTFFLNENLEEDMSRPDQTKTRPRKQTTHMRKKLNKTNKKWQYTVIYIRVRK